MSEPITLKRLAEIEERWAPWAASGELLSQEVMDLAAAYREAVRLLEQWVEQPKEFTALEGHTRAFLRPVKGGDVGQTKEVTKP